MAKYKFQFETGNIQDGSDMMMVNDFVGEITGEVNPSMALTIKAHGGQLVKEKPPAKSKAKNRKAGEK